MPNQRMLKRNPGERRNGPNEFEQRIDRRAKSRRPAHREAERHADHGRGADREQHAIKAVEDVREQDAALHQVHGSREDRGRRWQHHVELRIEAQSEDADALPDDDERDEQPEMLDLRQRTAATPGGGGGTIDAASRAIASGSAGAPTAGGRGAATHASRSQPALGACARASARAARTRWPAAAHRGCASCDVMTMYVLPMNVHGFVSSPGFGERRRAGEDRRRVRLVRQIADAAEVLRQDRRRAGTLPSELAERRRHVARLAHVLPVRARHLVLRRAGRERPLADPRLLLRPQPFGSSNG